MPDDIIRSARPAHNCAPERRDIGPAQWFAAQLKPGRFLEAERNLTRQNITSFMPTRLVELKRHRRLVAERRPLFPGYIFVSFDPTVTPVRSVNSTYGVSRLVMRNLSHPATVPTNLIDTLKERCDGTGTLLAAPDYVPGDIVKVLCGPFLDFVARVETIPAKERLSLLLEFMGQSIRADISAEDVEKIIAA